MANASAMAVRSKRTIAPVQIRMRRVIDAALSVFLESGFEGASVDEIVNRSGVSKPTIYKWFTNKEELFKAVTVQGAQNAANTLEWIVDDTRPPEIVLREAARRLLAINLLPEHRELMRVTLAEARRFPELANQIRKLTLTKTATPLEKYFARLAAAGVARIHGHEAFLSNMFLLLAGHGMRFLYSEPSYTEADYAHIDQAVDLFLNGFIGTAGRP